MERKRNPEGSAPVAAPLADAATVMAEVVWATRSALTDALKGDPLADALRDVPAFDVAPRVVMPHEEDRRPYRVAPAKLSSTGRRLVEIAFPPGADADGETLTVVLATTVATVTGAAFRVGGDQKALRTAKRNALHRLIGLGVPAPTELTPAALAKAGYASTSPVGLALEAAKVVRAGRPIGGAQGEAAAKRGGMFGIAWADDKGNKRFTPATGHGASKADLGRPVALAFHWLDSKTSVVTVSGLLAWRDAATGEVTWKATAAPATAPEAAPLPVYGDPEADGKADAPEGEAAAA